MASQQQPSTPADEAGEQLALPDLVICHLAVVLDVSKGWRVTVRVQDGWQGATLEHWSRGGSSIPHGVEKAVDDMRSALHAAMQYLPAF
jgi:hypothetical protein